MSSANIKTIILSGGTGYRLKEETEFKPKPMVEIGGKPILWHIMKIYEHFGFRDFIIALGYKGNLIKDYFVNKKYYDDDFTLYTDTHKIQHLHRQVKDYFNITFVDTGLETLTGERVRRLKKYIKEDNFMVTYGDGLADINIKKLMKFHQDNKKIGTVTGVYPKLRYGGLESDKKNLVSVFEMKTRVRQLINGGFMVFKKEVFKQIKPNSVIEDVYFPLIRKKQLALYEHKGFFQSMDTYQDMTDLNEMWRKKPNWKLWI
ncbi:MAG: Glucose-1-phosphate cytidylyltransferase [Parcubacteria group bacterium GW2011_GWC1_38_6]|uniref:Glucose-1-phosphate cytidylyltransferase n=1 Tax=Candidatus Curtissbacteria bacterium GW2011_GWA1_41_11 TaxID=1618409 RepID=A0A0G0XKH0_9BACT|nr:MAG: Glucose-1-phosphate cytidylyltransferase [Parcubacteria group bacterium GW2011_GWC1_38_6]KKR88152.1 MAG: Glucose-1-phosphate cytidylyltransferase [Candidatus Curtissbacteria bacterium GW2011_GWA1_41_11]